MRLCCATAIIWCLAQLVLGQNDNSTIRDATVLTYPPKQNVEIMLAGNKRFPKLSGTLKVERTEREGTKVEIKIKNLPAVLDLGGLYTTYIAWTIEPNGKTSNVAIIDSKVQGAGDREAKATTPLQAFAIVVTAEPHTQVRVPSRFVMLENDYSSSKIRYSITTTSVAYTVNNSDYFSNEQVVGSGEKAYRKIPLPVLRAERALSLARYANAELYASEKYKVAREKFTNLNERIKKKASSTEIEQSALEVEILASNAEEEAEKLRQLRRETQLETRRQNERKENEDSLAFFKERTDELTSQLQREEGRRLSMEQRIQDTEIKLDDANKESIRLKLENEELKKRVADVTAEKTALSRRLDILADFSLYRGFFAEFGKVREDRGSLVLTLPADIWSARSAMVAESNFNRLTPLFSKLSEKNDFEIVIIIDVEDIGDESQIRALAEARAALLTEKSLEFGIGEARVSRRVTSRALERTKSKVSPFRGLTEIEVRILARGT